MNETNYDIIVLQKGIPKTLQINSHKRRFAFIDYKSGYDLSRDTFLGQRFKVTENDHLVMKLERNEFKLYQKHGKPEPEEMTDYYSVNYEKVGSRRNNEIKEILKHYKLPENV